MKGKRKMDKKVNVAQLSKIMFLLLLLSITGCYATTHNLKTTDDLNGKKVLAGRFLFYDNDAPGKDSSRKFIMFFNKEGDKTAQALEPDEDGYIYVPVTAGQYNFAGIKVVSLMTGTFIFNLPTFPSVTVNDNDSAVNFGTYNVKFYQSAGAVAAALLVGFTRGHIKVEHVPDYDVTRSTIVTKIGTAMPLTDGKVTFLNRVQQTD